MKNLFGGKMGLLLFFLVVLLLAGLPVAVWMDLTSLAETNLSRQASDLNSIISSVRGYYASNVVGRILAAPGVATKVVHNYEDIPGAIPIPATLSLELGQVISERQHNITLPVRVRLPIRQPRAASARSIRNGRAAPAPRKSKSDADSSMSNSLFVDQVRLVAPVIMAAACVGCHNTHPESPKRDWKVGDVRGLQEVTITQPISGNMFAFKYLLAYFVARRRGRPALHRPATAPGRRHPRHEWRTGNGQRLSCFAVDEDIALPFAANLQEHFQRTEGRDHPDRAQEAHDLFLRYPEFHGDDGTAAAGDDHAAAQRIFHRNVQDRAAPMAAPSTSSSATPC